MPTRPVGSGPAELRVAGPGVDGMTRRNPLAGRLVAKTLIRSGDQRRGHESFSCLMLGGRRPRASAADSTVIVHANIRGPHYFH